MKKFCFYILCVFGITFGFIAMIMAFPWNFLEWICARLAATVV